MDGNRGLCGTAPQTTLIEGLRLWRDLPLRLTTRTVYMPPRSVLGQTLGVYRGVAHADARRFADLLLEMGGTEVSLPDGARLASRFVAVGLDAAPSLGRCPLLDGGACALAGRRPATCRAAPADPLLPDDMQADRPGDPEARAEARRLARADAPLQAVLARAVFGGDGEAPLVPNLGNEIVFAAMRGERTTMNFLTAARFARDLADAGEDAFADAPPVRDFLESQLALVRAALADNLARRRPEDRDATRILRSMERAYAAAPELAA